MKKSSIKKFFSVIGLFLVSCLLFSGCANVSYSVVMNAEGKIEQAMQVNLDKNEITLSGYSYDEVFSKVSDDFNEYFTALQQRIALYAVAKNKSVMDCGVTLYRQDLKEDAIVFGSIVFDSPIIYKEFYNISSSDDDDSSAMLEKTWFYDKDISETETIFSGIISNENNLAKEIADEYLSYFDGSLAGTTKKTLEDAGYTFNYGVPSKKLHSNSDKVYTQNGITIHQWNFTASQLGDKISTYTFTFKPTAWYILALGITAVSLCVVLVIGLIQKKFKKDKNTIAQEQK